MKVLLLANGASIHAARWVNGLAEAGLEIVLVTQDRDVLPLDGSVVVHQLPFSGSLGYFRNGSALRRIWCQEAPSLVHAHYASGYGTTARLGGCGPLLLSVWGSDVYRFPNRSPLHRWWLQGNLAAADRVASTSRAMAEQVRRLTPGIGQVEVTPFGIDLELFAPAAGPPTIADDAPIVIGTVKTLRPVYGIDLLVESFVRLRMVLAQEAPSVADRLRLRIVGDGPERESLSTLAAERGIARVTDFVPKVPHSKVAAELSKLDVYVALSRHESFGVAVLEASASGLPVIVSDAGGLPEVVRHAKTGFVVPRECPPAAADALKRLVLDAELRRTLGSAGRTHVCRHYGWRESVRRMIGIYQDMESRPLGNTLARKP
ncbi:glycosyltransferase [Altererythrobacter soli]|uniref:Glycosyltransferase n=1 Tax=Croceibacterium soli TaxID=1739690 RepID=A0A6I4URR5_9SPHN|nr:glycosyltransferase [Croceibacterium soli]MXP40273.1 glycosyltransferase [Croceibacterium soli]